MNVQSSFKYLAMFNDVTESKQLAALYNNDLLSALKDAWLGCNKSFTLAVNLPDPTLFYPSLRWFGHVQCRLATTALREALLHKLMASQGKGSRPKGKCN